MTDEKEIFKEIDPWANPPQSYDKIVIIIVVLIVLAILFWFFVENPNNRKPDLQKMVQYKINTLSEAELRSRLHMYEVYLEEQKLSIEKQAGEDRPLQKNLCEGKDEAFKLKNKCSTKSIIRTNFPKRDVIYEASYFKVKESYILQECFSIKNVRMAKKLGCLPK